MSRLAFALLATCALTGVAQAADPASASIPVRIAVIADLDGDIHDARSERGGAGAIRMASANSKGIVLGRPVVVGALNDHSRSSKAPGLAAAHDGLRPTAAQAADYSATVPAAPAFPAGTQCRMAP